MKRSSHSHINVQHYSKTLDCLVTIFIKDPTKSGETFKMVIPLPFSEHNDAIRYNRSIYRLKYTDYLQLAADLVLFVREGGAGLTRVQFLTPHVLYHSNNLLLLLKKMHDWLLDQHGG